LAPLLRAADQRERILAEAGRIRVEQAALAASGTAAIVPASVLARLVSAATTRVASRKPVASGAEHVVRASDGAVIARSQRAGRGGGVTISLPAPARHDRKALLRALEDILDHVIPPGKGA
jgi:hypothetical protein